MNRKWKWKRKLNAKFFLGLLGAAILLGAGIHFVHGAQVRRSASALLTQADRAEKSGNLEKTDEYLTRYLAFNPKDAAAMARLGRLREEKAETAEAKYQVIQAYEKALREAPNDDETRRRLVRLAVPLELFSEAKQHLKVLEGSVKNDGELTYFQGRCEEGNGQFTDAVKLYQEARIQDPSRIETYTRLANLLRTELHDPDRADQVMDARRVDGGLIAANGKSADAYLARARYRLQNGVEATAADDDVARALELDPDNADVILAAAQTAANAAEKAQAKGDQALSKSILAKAIADLKRGMKLHPKNTQIYMAVAQLNLQTNQLDDAVKTLHSGIKAEPDQAGLLGWILSDILLQAGKTKEATAEVESLRKRKTIRPEMIGYLDARVMMAEGQWTQALSILERVTPELMAQAGSKELAKRARLFMAKCDEQLGDQQKRVSAAHEAVEINLPEPDPLWGPAHLEYAKSLAAVGKIDDAIAQYRLMLPRIPDVGYAMTRLQMAQVLSRPESRRDWSGLDQTLDALTKTNPKSTTLAILRAESLLARGQRDQSIALIKQARLEHPDSVDLWIAEANLVAKTGTLKDVFGVLDQAQKQLGDRVELRIARSNQLVINPDESTSQALAALERDTDAFSPEDRDRLWRELSAAYSRISKTEDARRLWIQLADRHPDDLGIQLNLLDLALRTKNDADAAKALEGVREIEGAGGVFWSFGKARMLIDQAARDPAAKSHLAEASELLAHAGAQRPDWARIPLAEAEIADLNGNAEEATSKYLRAIIDLGDRSPANLRRVMQLLYQQQNYKQALTLVNQLEKDGPPSADLKRIATDLAFKNRDYARALALSQESLSESSKDYHDLLLLGQIYAMSKRPAEPLFRQAVALAPAAPETHSLLIAYLASQADKNAVSAALKEAERLLPKDQAALVLAEGYDAIGEFDQAEQEYQAALKAQPADVQTLRMAAAHYLRRSRMSDAEPLLQRIIDAKTDLGQSAWARRTLAQITALAGDPKSASHAEQILGFNAEAGTQNADPEDLRAEAKILVLQPGRSKRRQAIDTLEQILKRKAERPEDLVLLAQLYEADGDWNKARDLMLRLINTDAKDPAHLFQYVQALLRHDRAQEAVVYLAKLEKTIPDQPAVSLLKARVLKAAGKKSEALALLQGLAQKDVNQVGPVALLLEEFDEQAAAEELYRRYVKEYRAKQPAAVLALAQFLGRRGRVVEAMDLIDDDRTWKEIPAETVANTGTEILYAAKTEDDAQRQRLIRRLNETIRQRPDEQALQFSLANIQSLQGQYKEAETTFRSIYARDKRRGSPLNNLAWLIAVQNPERASEALELINQAIALEGELPQFLDTRALAYIAAGQSDPAIRDLLDSVTASPNSEGYFHLAQAYHLANKDSDALEAFEKAKSLGLTVDRLHPLERPAFKELEMALKLR